MNRIINLYQLCVSDSIECNNSNKCNLYPVYLELFVFERSIESKIDLTAMRQNRHLVICSAMFDWDRSGSDSVLLAAKIIDFISFTFIHLGRQDHAKSRREHFFTMQSIHWIVSKYLHSNGFNYNILRFCSA